MYHFISNNNSNFRYISIHRYRSTTEKQEKIENEDLPFNSKETQTNSNTFKDTTSSPGSSAFPYTVSMTFSQSSSSSSQSTTPLTTISSTITTTENPPTQSVSNHDESIFSTKTPSPSYSSVNSANVKLVEESATEILLATSPSTSPSTVPIETTTKEIFAAVSQPRPFGFTRGRSRSTSSSLDSTTPSSSSRSKVSKPSRNFARSSNTNQTRGRARSRVTTESSSHVSERIRDENGFQDNSTTVSRFRSRTRGPTRGRPTSTTPANEFNSRGRSRDKSPTDGINSKSRSRFTTSSPSANRNQSSRRGRRPTSKSNIGRGSRNELDDSSIIRISTDTSPKDQSRKSRRPGKSVEEASSRITNIRIFKDSENVDSRSRTRQGSKRFEDSTAQASFRDLSETTSTSRLEEETFFSPSSSYNFAKTTGTYLKSTEEKNESRGWTGLNSIHPYYSTDIGITATHPSNSVEPTRNRNFRKFTTNELSGRSSTTESTSARRRIILLRRRTGVETSTAGNDADNFPNKQRKVIRRLRPVQEAKSSTEKQADQNQVRQLSRSSTPNIEKTVYPSTTDYPSTVNEFYTTEPVSTVFDSTPFFKELYTDSTEGKTTLLDQTTKDDSTNPDYLNSRTTYFDNYQTSTVPTTLTIPDDFTTFHDFKTTYNIFENSRLPETSALFEVTSPLPVKTTESPNSRYKYSRRTPTPTSAITNARRFPTASTSNPSVSTEADPEALAKRRKNLFIRRRPSSKNQVEQKIEEKDNVSTKKTLTNSSLVGIDDFWKSFNTVRTFSPKASTEDPVLLLHTQPMNSEGEETVGPVYRRPEYRNSGNSRTVTSELAPEQKSDDRESSLRSTLSIYRKPRVRVQIDENSTADNDESQYKNRFFPKRISVTEQSVTETLIPAKKFDYVADAYLRKQQSQRGGSKSKNKEESDLQNFVDIYSTTPSSKPQITRLVTSVVESATTERQKILIRRKYSQLTSTSFVPPQTTPDPTSFLLKRRSKDKLKNESQNEIRSDSTEASVEKSTLPIESAFLRNGGKFTTESTGESSTIEIESVFNNLISSSRDSRQ